VGGVGIARGEAGGVALEQVNGLGRRGRGGRIGGEQGCREHDSQQPGEENGGFHKWVTLTISTVNLTGRYYFHHRLIANNLIHLAIFAKIC
jgi:hypothetical protein